MLSLFGGKTKEPESSAAPAPPAKSVIPTSGAKRRVRPRRRRYAAAKMDRLTLDWRTTTTSADSDLVMALAPLRARARQLEMDNAYVRRFLNSIERNVIGPEGIELEMMVRQRPGSDDLDEQANRIITDAWNEWIQRGVCTMCGTMNLAQAGKIHVRTMARDGEVLTRRVRGREAGNRFNYAIHMMEPDYLDHEYNGEFRRMADTLVRMGVEKDTWDRPLAYYLLSSHPGDVYVTSSPRRHLVVSSNDILHNFIPTRLHATRGVTWLHAAASLLFQADRYLEAEVVAARIASSKMGFLTPEGDSYEGDDEDDDGELITEVEPGILEELPRGMKVDPVDWNSPNTDSAVFLKTLLKGVGAGLDQSYVTLGNDLEGVNYSSIRQGELDQRDVWRSLQAYEVANWYQVLFEDWLEMALTSGQLGNLPISRFDKFAAGATWQPRGWEWVDPQKEVGAALDAIDGLLDSRSSVIRKRGRSLREVWAQLAAENALMEQLEITPGSRTPPPPPAATGESNGQAD